MAQSLCQVQARGQRLHSVPEAPPRAAHIQASLVMQHTRSLLNGVPLLTGSVPCLPQGRGPLRMVHRAIIHVRTLPGAWHTEGSPYSKPRTAAPLTCSQLMAGPAPSKPGRKTTRMGVWGWWAGSRC